MPRSVSDSVIGSINSCLYGVIPSLFCFIVLSKLISNSGVAYIISKPFGSLFSKLTGIPGIGASVYIFSFLSGYPSGVIASVELYKNGMINKEDAEGLCAVCDNTGPALPVILIGSQILNNVWLGVLIYVIQILASVTACLIFRSKSAGLRENVYSNAYNKGLFTAIAESLEGGIKACAIMCGYIIMFNVIGDALSNIFKGQTVLHYFRPFIEIVSGSAGLSGIAQSISTVLLSTAITFGGACVHMQAASVMSGEGLSGKLHFKFKLIQSLCAFIISCVIVFFGEIGLF